MARLGLIILSVVFVLPVVEAGQFNNNPGTVWLQENYDGVHNVWGISATCYVQYTYSYDCYNTYYVSCGWWGYGRCTRYYWYTCYAHAYTDVSCNVCYINSDASGHFQMSGNTVQKRMCTSLYCGPRCSSSGCLNGGDSHGIGVSCYRTGYNTNGHISTSFTVSISYAAAPTFYFSNKASIEISHDDYGVGGVINTIVPSTSDNGYDYDYARYRQSRAPGSSYLHQTSDLFKLDTSNGQIKVNKDLTLEFSYFFDMQVCVYDRREREVCHDMYIKLWACFQTPNCTDQDKWSLHDTYGTYTGHGGSSNVVFNPIVPNPTKHFASDFSSTWHKLTYTFDFNEFPELTINSDSGVMSITRNISIWPAWPTKDYRARVRIANRESCYTTTCDFFVRVHYTNWPIEIRSLPNVPQWYQHEDDDDGHLLQNLVVYDYNYESEDNMTCYIHRISPHEDDLFFLDHDGNYKWNSYTLYKLECQQPDCGYKHPLPSEFTHSAWQRFYCDTDIGCLTYNRTQQYTVTIKCDDAYNTTDEKDFTFNVIKNEVPIYRHLPTLVDLDRTRVSLYDNIFEIMYWDLEEENLIYEYTYQDVDPPYADPEYFLGTTWGNFYDNLGNITMEVHLWDKPANKSYRIHICGHERRNEICEDLIVDVEEYCSEPPTCNDASVTVDTTTVTGTLLFQMATLVPSIGLFSDLTYSIKSAYGNLFALDSRTGQLTVADTFPEVYPSASYSIVGYVYNRGACLHGTCQLVVHVDFVNFPISITNDPTASGYIHEDETDVKVLLTLEVSDDNVVDSYTCNITSTNNGPFYLDRSPPQTGLYYLKNRENYALTSDPASYNIETTCYDQYGSSDSYTFPIDVEPNLAPVFDASTDWSQKNVNVSAAAKGDVIYRVSASDKEADEIEWTCEVDTNINPLTCTVYASYVVIYLRRSLENEYDDGRVAEATICISDDKHPSSSDPSSQCGTISVAFTLIRIPPTIDNINEWPVIIAEDTPINTPLYTASVYNPDVGETTTISMKIYPSSYKKYFKFNQGTKELILAKQLDYEKIKGVRFEFSVKDNYLDGLEDYVVFLNVTNVNEGNTLTAGVTEITFPEDTQPNTVLPDLGLSCEDIDGDNVTLSIIDAGNYSSYFSLDEISGELTLLKEWDLETNIAPDTSLVIQCADAGGETSTVVVDVTVTDVNEFEPFCEITFIAASPLLISPKTSFSIVLLTIECTDADRDSGDDFIASPLGLGFSSKFFRMLSRSNRKRATGASVFDVKLKDTIDLSNDKSFEVTFMISDGDGNALFSGVTVAVNFTSSDPDEKSKEDARCLTCTTNGQVIVGVLVLEGVIIVLFVIHACCSMMCHKNKVLRLADFDVSKNSRIKPPPKNDSTFDQKSKKMETSFTPSKVAIVPQVQASKTGKNQRKDVSSSSDSSSDDDDQTARRDIGHGKFQMRPAVPSMQIGLASPIYASGPGSVHSGGGMGGFARGNQQPTGLPPPIYSSRASSQATSGHVPGQIR